MTNAFPYTDVSRLWVDMYAAGVGGPFFDWMRMVYARMTYATKYGDENCLPFRSLIGLLTGDSASPCLWNIFFADFRLRELPDNVRLHGHAISQAEQADDNIIMSTSFHGLQAKVHAFFRWCSDKRVFVSARKSKWMIFVELVHEFKYVGIWLTSTTSNIFSRNYEIKASKARNACNAIFAMKHRTGSLPVKEGLQLYMARVDCYLISAAEISIDVDAHLLDNYLDAQHLFLRRLLGINSRSMLAVLFTETGLMPIRIRRLLLAFSRLRYMVALGDDRRVRWGLLDSVDLFAAGRASWAGDIAILLRALPTPIRIAPQDFLSITAIDAIAKKIAEAVDADLQFDINFLQKTHLLRNRLELVEESRSLALVTRRRRHYLTMVHVPAHRVALTRLLLSDHNLSVERLRYATRYRRPIPREERLCRLCRRDVEDEVHAMLDCEVHVPLVGLRKTFLTDVFECDSALRDEYERLSHYEFLRRMISSRKGIQRVAKYVSFTKHNDVMKLWRDPSSVFWLAAFVSFATSSMSSTVASSDKKRVLLDSEYLATLNLDVLKKIVKLHYNVNQLKTAWKIGNDAAVALNLILKGRASVNWEYVALASKAKVVPDEETYKQETSVPNRNIDNYFMANVANGMIKLPSIYVDADAEPDENAELEEQTSIFSQTITPPPAEQTQKLVSMARPYTPISSSAEQDLDKEMFRVFVILVDERHNSAGYTVPARATTLFLYNLRKEAGAYFVRTAELIQQLQLSSETIGGSARLSTSLTVSGIPLRSAFYILREGAEFLGVPDVPELQVETAEAVTKCQCAITIYLDTPHHKREPESEPKKRHISTLSTDVEDEEDYKGASSKASRTAPSLAWLGGPSGYSNAISRAIQNQDRSKQGTPTCALAIFCSYIHIVGNITPGPGCDEPGQWIGLAKRAGALQVGASHLATVKAHLDGAVEDAYYGIRPWITFLQTAVEKAEKEAELSGSSLADM
ncbi:Reverse transcriptase domain-containing protein [Mycena venus]|uniref:Reverse transcriptase domain-containing protein n=1 Tax=Mycena venus TaxID=2733690 RepID=A0A8H7D434_9AGAR|nr:Reverse transcriptase domain-containing protein [Mycena venus]